MSEPEKSQEADAHEHRVQRILKRARDEVGLRDFLTFCGARLWIAFVAVGSAIYVAITHRIETQTRRD